MDSTELKSEIEDLKLMLLDPKLFINKYIDDLINQIDIQSTEYEIKANEKIKKVTTDYEVLINIDKFNDWRQRMVEEIRQAELKLLSRITPEYKLNIEEFQIKAFKEDYNNENHNVTSEKYNELKKRVYEYSYLMKQDVMENQCFVVLNQEMTYHAIKNNNLESPYFWSRILPLMHVKEGFIGKKGQRYLK